ncbi:MAG: hypothetical protein ABI476_05215, partial [Oxalobacteraceae bacterium]
IDYPLLQVRCAGHFLPATVSRSPELLFTKFSSIHEVLNEVEGSITAPSASLQPHQRHYAHAAIAV